MTDAAGKRNIGYASGACDRCERSRRACRQSLNRPPLRAFRSITNPMRV